MCRVSLQMFVCEYRHLSLSEKKKNAPTSERTSAQVMFLRSCGLSQYLLFASQRQAGTLRLGGLRRLN